MARRVRHIHASPNEWVRVHRGRPRGGGGESGCGLLTLMPWQSHSFAAPEPAVGGDSRPATTACRRSCHRCAARIVYPSATEG